MDGNRKWFGHHRNGDKKKSVSQIVATENQDCDDQRFLVVTIFIFFQQVKNNSHPINDGLISIIDLMIFFVAFFFPFFFKINSNLQ
jgi:hypothetical protein